MSNKEIKTTQEATDDLRMKFMPMMDDGFRDIARAMGWTQVRISGSITYADTMTMTATLFGPCATREISNVEHVRVVSAVACDEKTAIARMREQALDIARASVGMLLRTIDVSRSDIRVAMLGIFAIERESR